MIKNLEKTVLILISRSAEDFNYPCKKFDLDYILEKLFKGGKDKCQRFVKFVEKDLPVEIRLVIQERDPAAGGIPIFKKLGLGYLMVR